MHKIKHYLKKITNPVAQIKLTTPVAIIMGAVFISISIIGYGLITRINTSNGKTVIFTGRDVNASDYVDENSDSKVVVIEYSDTECPYCISLHPTMKQLREEYSDKVQFVYRHFPLTRIHPRAFDESKAIACAGKVGGTDKYFKYIDTLFDYKSERQSETNSSPILPANAKEDFANKIGLNIKDFNKCMGSDEAKKEIENSINDGIQAGVEGTPSTFILVKTKDGYEIVSMIDGARQKSYFDAAIQEALNK